MDKGRTPPPCVRLARDLDKARQRFRGGSGEAGRPAIGPRGREAGTSGELSRPGRRWYDVVPASPARTCPTSSSARCRPACRWQAKRRLHLRPHRAGGEAQCGRARAGKSAGSCALRGAPGRRRRLRRVGQHHRDRAPSSRASSSRRGRLSITHSTPTSLRSAPAKPISGCPAPARQSRSCSGRATSDPAASRRCAGARPPLTPPLVAVELEDPAAAQAIGTLRADSRAPMNLVGLPKWSAGSASAIVGGVAKGPARRRADRTRRPSVERRPGAPAGRPGARCRDSRPRLVLGSHRRQRANRRHVQRWFSAMGTLRRASHQLACRFPPGRRPAQLSLPAAGAGERHTPSPSSYMEDTRKG